MPIDLLTLSSPCFPTAAFSGWRPAAQDGSRNGGEAMGERGRSKIGGGDKEPGGVIMGVVNLGSPPFPCPLLHCTPFAFSFSLLRFSLPP